uniref:uncharacterized protein LOC113474636 n=1 Tax=Ciona intestinalis TaxID=7719 RepID=UPI000EF5539B|nr:uncharacterized protein LOC113474636 [Ciona intestinalis]|eukprot:XP_026692274.1 uncharacterized protein LOC113474636 [Ciona intestinalis]
MAAKVRQPSHTKPSIRNWIFVAGLLFCILVFLPTFSESVALRKSDRAKFKNLLTTVENMLNDDQALQEIEDKNIYGLQDDRPEIRETRHNKLFVPGILKRLYPLRHPAQAESYLDEALKMLLADQEHREII